MRQPLFSRLQPALRFFLGILLFFAAVLFSTVPAFAQTNYTTTITLSRLQAIGGLVPYATVCAQPSDQYGNPITVSAPTWGLLLPSLPPCGSVVNGAISGGLPVPDASHTYASSAIYYDITIQRTTSSGSPIGQLISLNAVPNITGTSWALDSYAPTVSSTITPANSVSYGSSVPSSCTAPSLYATNAGLVYSCVGGTYVAPPGLGALVPQGAYAGGTNYGLGALVSSGSLNYYSLIANNFGNTPSSSPSAWQLLGATGPTGPTGATGPAGPNQISPWAQSTAYTQLQPVSYSGAVYTANSAFTSGSTFNPANWTQVADATGAAATATTPAAIAAQIQTLSGCNTTGFVLQPHSGNCVAQSAGGSPGTIVADGTTYTTIQAAYVAACALTPNEDVLVPTNSTVTDSLLTFNAYVIPSCTTKAKDERYGMTFGAEGSVLFTPQVTRHDYLIRQANHRLTAIKLAENVPSTSALGMPAVNQWVVWNDGDSTTGMGDFLKVFELTAQYGLAGAFIPPGSGAGNNGLYFGASNAGGLSVSQSFTGTETFSNNGSQDPVSPTGSVATMGTLGSSTAAGVHQTYAAFNTEGTNSTYQTFNQAAVIYEIEGPQNGAAMGSITVSTSPDGVNFVTESTVSAAASATTGSIVTVGYNGSGQAPGVCTGNVAITATGYGGSGSGFAATGVYDPAIQQIGTITITNGGSGYQNPVTFSSTGGGCSVQPPFGPALLSNQSIGVVTVSHPGIGVLQVANSGGAVRILGNVLLDTTRNGVVQVNLGFGGSAEYSRFQAPSSYNAPFWQAIPAPDTVFIEQFDNNEIGGGVWGRYITQWDTLAQSLQAVNAAQYTTATTCNAAGLFFNTVTSGVPYSSTLTSNACAPVRSDIVYLAGYKVGTVDGGSAAGIPLQNFTALQAITTINRGGGNAYYEDLYEADINPADSYTRLEFGFAPDGTHKGAVGVAAMNTLTMRDAFLPPGLLDQGVDTSFKAGPGSRQKLAFKYLGIPSGLYYNGTLHQQVLAGGAISEGSISVVAPTYDAPTAVVVGAAGTVSATYVIYVGSTANYYPIGVTAPVTVNIPSPPTATNYVAFCLLYQIPGATNYTLVRTAGGASQGYVYGTGVFTNRTTPNCLFDTGQSTSTYTGGAPAALLKVGNPTLDSGQNMANMATPDALYNLELEEGYSGGNAGAGIAVRAASDTARANMVHFNLALSATLGGYMYATGTYAAAPLRISLPVQAGMLGGSGLPPTLSFTTGTGPTTTTNGSTNAAGSFTATATGATVFHLIWASSFLAAHKGNCTFVDTTTPANIITDAPTGSTTSYTIAQGNMTTGDLIEYTCVTW